MRQSTDICLLCKTSKSSQKNSHLIPKFLGKGIFEGSNPKHGIQIQKNWKTKKIQDITKEDYLLCPACEKGFSVFENYCSLRLERFNEIRYYQNFKRFKNGEFEFFECLNLNSNIFNLFIYSIVWRVSVSETFTYNKFKLPQESEDDLRELLHKYIKPNQKELMDVIDDFKLHPKHSHVIIRPNKKLRPPGSMLSAASLNETIHQLHLVDYLIFYILDKTKLSKGFLPIDNNRPHESIRVGLMSPKQWQNLNYDLINKMMK